MAMFPGDCSFEELAPSIFRIEATCDRQTFAGTGFTVALFMASRRLVLSTAKHVLDFPKDKPVLWKVEQFDQHGTVTRGVTFQSKPPTLGGLSIFTHNLLDIGLHVLPELGADGQKFGTEAESPPRVIDITSGVSTGTRVGWAGFAGVVEDTLGFPQLCYFEGVVSAMVNRKDKQLYIVDGHAAQGVSGGPVWHWSEERSRVEIVGVVSAYQALSNGLPGFCMFEPVNPTMYFLESKQWHNDVVGDHLITNRRG